MKSEYAPFLEAHRREEVLARIAAAEREQRCAEILADAAGHAWPAYVKAAAQIEHASSLQCNEDNVLVLLCQLRRAMKANASYAHIAEWASAIDSVEDAIQSVVAVKGEQQEDA